MWGFVGESVGYGILNESWMEESSYDFFGNLYVKFRDESCDKDYGWELGEVMIVKEVSGSSPIESGKVLGGGLVLS